MPNTPINKLTNPLLNKYDAPFGAVPFGKITAEDFMPALEAAIKIEKQAITQIKNTTDSPNFSNTILPMLIPENSELLDLNVEQVARIFYAVYNAETNDALREVAKKFAPAISNFSNDKILDQELFFKIKVAYEGRKNDKSLGRKLNEEELRILEDIYQEFVRNGALLPPEKKQRLRIIDEKLSRLGTEFSDNVLKATNNFFLVLDKENEEEVKGLPIEVREMAQETAKSKGKEGKLVFTLDAPSYLPFMKYSENRSLREKLHRAYLTLASDGETDNRPKVLEIACLRHERAKLLGYPTHADFVLEKRMAENKQRVENFLEQLLNLARPFAIADIEELSDLQKRMHPKQQEVHPEQQKPHSKHEIHSPSKEVNQLMPWDFLYYSEKLKREKFNIDDEVLRPYFQLEKVLDGVFQIASRLYGLEFILAETEVGTGAGSEEGSGSCPGEGSGARGKIPVYHSEVKVYEVWERNEAGPTSNKKFIGLIYFDFFPRPGKRNGAWMEEIKDQFIFNGIDRRPHVGVVCNFTRPTPSRPSLLSWDEVQTLFHEFGHGLHGLLSECYYSYFSGTKVYWDFVELPSQIMENWCQEKESLDLFAIHCQTGQKISSELVEKIKKSSKFLEGYATVRQLMLGFLDMAWHATDPGAIVNSPAEVVNYERKAIAKAQILPVIDEANISCSYRHIFSGGYSSGYYSYKWAEVLDADAFEYFKEKGIFNQEVANSFRHNILSRGGTEHPMELFKRFRGKEPSLEPLLRRSGLTS